MPSTKAAGGGIFSGVFTQGRQGTTQGQEDFELSWYLFFQQAVPPSSALFAFPSMTRPLQTMPPLLFAFARNQPTKPNLMTTQVLRLPSAVRPNSYARSLMRCGEIIAFLDANSGGLHAIDMIALRTNMHNYYTQVDGIPQYINMLEDVQKKATRAGMPITNVMLMMMA